MTLSAGFWLFFVRDVRIHGPFSDYFRQRGTGQGYNGICGSGRGLKGVPCGARAASKSRYRPGNALAVEMYCLVRISHQGICGRASSGGRER